MATEKTTCIVIIRIDGQKKKIETTAGELFRAIRYDGGKIKKFLAKKLNVQLT